jgi:sirohydrochlorin ferrochelatase
MSEITAILLIAHGSRHEPANQDLRRMAGSVAELGLYSIVEPAFLELTVPEIPEAGGTCVSRGATRVLMIPYFLSAGVHLVRDLTAARDTLNERFPAVEFLLGSPLGPHPLLEALVLERVKELETAGPKPDLGSATEMAQRFTPLGDH